MLRAGLLHLALLMVIPALAGPLEKAFKALEVHDYFKARDLFRKEVKKHPAAAWYGLSVITGRANNPFYDLDSAYQFIVKADLSFTAAPDKERVYIGALGVSHTSIMAQRDHVYERAWEIARGQNTVLAYKAYLDRYPSGPRAEEARSVLHHLAFQEARRVNTAAAYQAFVEDYRDAREVYEARARLNDALYEEATSLRTIAAYKTFIKAHPDNPNVRKAEDEIYRLSTPGRTIVEYRNFIKTEPDNHRVPDAWRSLYETYTKDLNVGAITRFIAEFPDYPFMEELVDDYRTASIELIPFRRNGKWGFVDTEGNERIKAEYDWVDAFVTGQAQVGIGDRVGTINRSGRVVVAVEYDEVGEFAEGTAVVERAGRFGAVDRSGELVVPMVYTDLGDLSEGLAYAEDHGKFGYVNARGEMVISPVYGTAANFHRDRAVVGVEEKYGVIGRSGQVVVPLEYDWIEGFAHGPSRVRKNGRTGLMSVHGETLLPVKYDHIGAFHDGLALIVEGGKCGYADTTGRLVIGMDYEAGPDVATWGDFAHGRAEVQSGGKRGIIGKRNERIVPFQYVDVGGTKGPLFPVKKKNKWGLVDQHGTMLIDAKYDLVWDFNDGLARIQVGGLFGAVDSTGKEVIAPTLGTLADARFGIMVGGGDHVGAFDRTGKAVIPAEHDEVLLINERIARVTNGEHFAYRDITDGHYIWKEQGFKAGSTE